MEKISIDDLEKVLVEHLNSVRMSCIEAGAYFALRGTIYTDDRSVEIGMRRPSPKVE